MLPVQDHKRLLDGDQGPNTGGMGTFCPYHLTDDDMNYIREHVLQKAVDGLAKEKCPFVGNENIYLHIRPPPPPELFI